MVPKKRNCFSWHGVFGTQTVVNPSHFKTLIPAMHRNCKSVYSLVEFRHCPSIAMDRQITCMF